MVILLPFQPSEQEGVLSASQEPSAAALQDFSILPAAPQRLSAPPQSRRIVNQTTIARLLAHFLNNSGGTLSAASQRLGIAPQSLRQYLSGKRSKPSIEWLIRYLAAIDATLTVRLSSGETIELIYTPPQEFK